MPALESLSRSCGPAGPLKQGLIAPFLPISTVPCALRPGCHHRWLGQPSPLALTPPSPFPQQQPQTEIFPRYRADTPAPDCRLYPSAHPYTDDRSGRAPVACETRSRQDRSWEDLTTWPPRFPPRPGSLPAAPQTHRACLHHGPSPVLFPTPSAPSPLSSHDWPLPPPAPMQGPLPSSP